MGLFTFTVTPCDSSFTIIPKKKKKKKLRLAIRIFIEDDDEPVYL